jgi:hypothetical protein
LTGHIAILCKKWLNQIHSCLQLITPISRVTPSIDADSFIRFIRRTSAIFTLMHPAV